MKFYKRLIFCVLFIFFSCEKYKVISSFELSLKDPWNRKEVVEKQLTVDNVYDKVGFVLDIYYNEEVQYQNIFLHIKLSDAEGNVIFEKPDLMLMLFDPATGYPLGRKIFRKQHLEFLITEDLKLKEGKYNVEILQKTRAENLCGIEQFICKFIK